MEPIEQTVEHDLAVVAGQLNVGHARLVRLMATVLASDRWQGCGMRSAEQYATVRLGVSWSFARRLVRVANRADELPAVFAAFDEGLLSFDLVDIAASYAPSWADPQILDLAEHTTTEQLRKALKAICPNGPDTPPPGQPDPTNNDSGVAEVDDGDDQVDEADGGEGTDTHDRRTGHEWVRFGWTPDGRLTGSFDLDADTGMLVEAALNEARDALFQAGVHDATWADTIAEISARSLETAGNARRQRHTAMIHINIADTNITAYLSNGVALPDTVTEYLTCDGNCRPIWMNDHTPLGAGTDTRVIPANLRRIITFRDQGCRAPGCNSTHVEIHHIVHWANGGATESWNLISLCAQHHKMHHQDRLHITGNPDLPGNITFTDAHHRPLVTGPKPKPPDSHRELPHSTHFYEGASGERLNLKWLNEFTNPATYRQTVIQRRRPKPPDTHQTAA